MVSPTLTQIEKGTVEYKPEPKERSGKDGPWTSYQIKVGEKYFDCNEKVYNAVRVGEGVEFTYSTRTFTYKSGQKEGQTGEGYKIADLIGAPDAPSEATVAPQGNERPKLGMIGSLNGAEIGAMENRAWQMAIALHTTNDETLEALLMQQARLGSWFKAQPIPSMDDEPIPLQDDPVPLSERQARDPQNDDPEAIWGDEPPGMNEGPYPTVED